MSGGSRLGYEMASRATAYRCWRAHSASVPPTQLNLSF
jgi:hypothetical protein